MRNLESETYTTVDSNSVQNLRSRQLMFSMAAVLESLVPVQAVITSVSWSLMARGR